jgi:hypothetical protein
MYWTHQRMHENPHHVQILTAGISVATPPKASALQFAYTCNVN